MKHHTTHLLRSGLAKRLKWSKCQLALDPVPLRTLGSSVGALVSARGPATRAWQMAKQNGKRWRQWMEVACLCTCRRRQRVVQTATAPRRQHHRRPRGEPLEVTMKIWQQPLLNCVPLSCAAAVDLTALNCASIETTAPNFSASKRMSVQISAYLHRNMQKLPMVFRANWFWTLQDWLVEYE